MAADEIHDAVFAQGLFRQDGNVRPDKSDLDIGVLRLELAGALHVVGEAGRTGVHHDEFVIFGDFENVVLCLTVRRGVNELAARNERGGLREPGRKPVRGNFSLGLVARTGAAIKSVERGRTEEQGFQHERNSPCSRGEWNRG